MKPLATRILIEPQKPELKTKGGLYLPDEGVARQLPTKGDVLARGPKVSDNIRVGMTVVFAKYAGTKFGDNIIIDEADVLGVM